MRLFVAVEVPDDIKDAIESDVVDALRPGVEGARWTRPEGRHLTLKFLGEVDEVVMDEVGEALEDVVPPHRTFEAAFAELGGFPNLRRPRVLWLGIGEGAEPMRALAGDIETRLGALGFESENRPFHPHFTLARFPRPKVMEQLPEVSVPSRRFPVAEVVLFRSQLHPKGARYTALSSYALRT